MFKPFKLGKTLLPHRSSVASVFSFFLWPHQVQFLPPLRGVPRARRPTLLLGMAGPRFSPRLLCHAGVDLSCSPHHYLSWMCYFFPCWYGESSLLFLHLNVASGNGPIILIWPVSSYADGPRKHGRIFSGWISRCTGSLRNSPTTSIHNVPFQLKSECGLYIH